MRAGVAALVFGASAIAAGAQIPPPATATGVRGIVLTHEDAPVTSGAVVFQGPETSSAAHATIDRNGRFHAVVSTRGLYRLSINVPGFAPHRVNVEVPASRTISLPAIRLIAPTYIRARFVNAAGEPILSPRLRFLFQNGDRLSMFAGGDNGAARLDGEDGITLGPLGRGIHTQIFDMPGMALTALKPVTVTGEVPMLDAGTIAIQPGTTLHVDVVDGNGAPVANHMVAVEDVNPDSPLSLLQAPTDQHGRVTFTRLAAGRYRVSARLVERCNGYYLSASRLVTVNGSGQARQPLILGGTVRLLFTSPFGPLQGVPVSITPDSGARPAGRPVPGRPPMPMLMTGCRGSTDGDGKVTFTNVPPGPVRIEVRTGNSTHQRRANVRSDAPELPIAIPDGLLQLHAANELTGQPLIGATVTVDGGGRRVQTTTTGTGDALLEGVGDEPGSIAIEARGFVTDSARIVVTPVGTYEATMRPDPPFERRVHVVGPDGKPVPRAIVELLPPTVLDILLITSTGADGVVRFGAPAGTLSAIARADGFAPTSFSLPAANDAPVVVTLTPSR